jgi:hypothetical protein
MSLSAFQLNGKTALAERTFLLLCKRNHFCPQISPHRERHPNLPFANQRFGLW